MTAMVEVRVKPDEFVALGRGATAHVDIENGGRTNVLIVVAGSLPAPSNAVGMVLRSGEHREFNGFAAGDEVYARAIGLDHGSVTIRRD